LYATQFLRNCVAAKSLLVPPALAGADGVNMVGRVPLIPLILAGNSTSTSPAAVDDRLGSNAYGVKQWLWQFGRGKPRLGGLSIEKTGARKKAAQKERLLHGAETRRCRKADLA
jgi:hypothetical protein